MVTFTINISPMLAYIPVPWIRHGYPEGKDFTFHGAVAAPRNRSSASSAIGDVAGLLSWGRSFGSVRYVSCAPFNRIDERDAHEMAS